MQQTKLLVPVYAITLLLSAILLFSVQPMFTKMILPMLGGTPQVWNTAMLFFQACLLGGYAYAHFTSQYLSRRTQGILHIALLTVFIGVLPFAIPQGWEPPTETDPTLWQLSLMALTVGGPFFILSGSAPMLQHWFAQSSHKDAANPYFLYGASNLGSMTALLTYPVLTEPLLALPQQTHLWMIGYFILILCIAFSLLLAGKNASLKIKDLNLLSEPLVPISNSLRAKWLILAAIPSSLMLGVTTYITTDVASVPMLWVIPLALYLGTFIIVFANRPIFKTRHIHLASGIGIAVLLGMIIIGDNIAALKSLQIPLHMFMFFIAALSCHQELANSKPSAKHLTEFYLIMSLGGVIGGFVNAIIAPQFFIIPIEYPLALGVAMLMRFSNDSDQSFLKFLGTVKAKIISINLIFLIFVFSFAFMGFSLERLEIDIVAAALVFGALIIDIKKRWAFGVLATALLLISPMTMPTRFFANEEAILRDRNFFGIIKIVEDKKVRALLHGTTIHGSQAVEEKHKLTHISYYSKFSPMGDVFSVMDQTITTSQNVGIIGLGVGILNCYKHDGRSFDFYEIDKDIVDIAENKNYFTYLSDCGSPYQIILGDGRLKIAQKSDSTYDMIVLDAFSSDNIPVHLLTKEAIQIYLKKLKPDGLLILHISNNYLDLEPVVGNLAKSLNIRSVAQVNNGGKIDDTGIEAFPSHYVAVSNNLKIIDQLIAKGWSDTFLRPELPVWTDQYSNIFSVMDSKSGSTRAKAIKAAEQKK